MKIDGADTKCPTGWEYYSPAGTCISMVDSVHHKGTWEEASILCNVFGGKLVKILSDAENAFIWDKVNNYNSSLWIGLSDTKHEQGVFYWNDDLTETQYTAWDSDDPFQSETGCVIINNKSATAAQWTVVDCNNHNNFICEIAADCKVDKNRRQRQCPDPCSANCRGHGDGTACETRTGRCFLGCKSGYMGPLCKTSKTSALSLTLAFLEEPIRYVTIQKFPIAG
ncbi:mannose receptor, C type 2 [Elysia marginata]|uniref:Mannose receptor, C type 2 n=1 Tax=Elysia marginata TaxID=1093978 RepID=A0AAV4GUB8_9GAST|nr:mannose receptor, C type 2 [Elysia marginata]